MHLPHGLDASYHVGCAGYVVHQCDVLHVSRNRPLHVLNVLRHARVGEAHFIRTNALHERNVSYHAGGGWVGRGAFVLACMRRRVRHRQCQALRTTG